MDLATVARFWSHVDKNGPVHPKLKTRCWVWVGGKTKNGYGRFRHNGKVLKAHRVSWLVTHGRWPNPNALHHCDNTACTRPEHLFEGTQTDNILDMVAKKRNNAASGEHNGRAKLSKTDVLQIRADYAPGVTTQRQLARKYKVSQFQVMAIVNRLNWR